MEYARPDSSAASARKRPAALGLLLVLPALVLLLGMSAAAPATLTPQQAPNSRVVIDLPPEYTPSPLFAGFQNEVLGSSFIILEAPAGEYDKMAQGFTPQELAKRGITDARTASLPRSDTHVYMRAKQVSPAGSYEKFFVLFRTADQTILVSANVPSKAVEDGSVKPEEIESILASAKTTEKPALRDCLRSPISGPSRRPARSSAPARSTPSMAGSSLSSAARRARPSWSLPRSTSAASSNPTRWRSRYWRACRLPQREAGRAARHQGRRARRRGGLARAIDEDDNTPVHLYQAMLLGKDGGYFRLIGIATDTDAARIEPEFHKIADSFALLP